MPHLRLEYTRDRLGEIDFLTLFQRLHQVLARVGGIDVQNCKSRAFPVETFLVGDDQQGDAFVHLDVQLLAGRSEEVMGALGEALLQQLRLAFLPAPQGVALQLTVALGEIPRGRYFKGAAASIASC